MFIMLDKNEEVNSPHIAELLRRFFPKLEVTTLDCGDIKVILEGGDILAIERKRASDFLGSIGDGRLFNQVERMSQSSKWCCVLIEGFISFDKDDMAVIPVYDKRGNIIAAETTGWKGASVRGAMYAVQWAGCPIITIEPYSLPHIVSDLIRFCTKPTEHTQMLGRHRVVTFPQPTLGEEIVASFPGVGLKRSRAMNTFAAGQNDNGIASLAEILTWISVLHKIQKRFRPEGWGDVTINNVRTAMGLQPWEELNIVIDEEMMKKENPELYKTYIKEKKAAGKNGKG